MKELMDKLDQLEKALDEVPLIQELKKLTKEIKSKLVKKYGKSVFYPSSLDEISASDVNFYLKPGKKAIVHFNKYEISYGAAGDFAVKLTSKYK